MTGRDPMWIYEQVRQPPAGAVSRIEGGRMQGKSSISAQWRIEALTEVFGPCGEGWKIADVQQTSLPGPHEQVLLVCLLNLYVRIDGEWSEPIPGIGTSVLRIQLRDGPFFDSEAPKKARTDALSNAARHLGVAGDIYANKGPAPPMRSAKPGVDPQAQQLRQLRGAVHNACMERGDGSHAEASKIREWVESKAGKPIADMSAIELRSALNALQQPKEQTA